MAVSAPVAAPRWWPVDYLILGYLAVMAVVVAAWCAAVPGAAWLIGAHMAGIAALFIFRSNQVFHSWYPLPYVAACYKEMAILIPPIRHTDFDAAMMRLDARLWGADPIVWLARCERPALTEFLQVCYALFVPSVLLVAFLLWRSGRFAEFRYYAFLIALGFLASYLGYLAVPVRGPRFFLRGLPPLRGLWSTGFLRVALDRLESAHYDCFPSGHVELTMLACWGSRLISKGLFGAFLGYTACVIFATVYLRYHYTVDVLAGAALAFVLVAIAPHIYDKLEKGAIDWAESKSSRQ